MWREVGGKKSPLDFQTTLHIQDKDMETDEQNFKRQSNNEENLLFLGKHVLSCRIALLPIHATFKTKICVGKHSFSNNRWRTWGHSHSSLLIPDVPKSLCATAAGWLISSSSCDPSASPNFAKKHCFQFNREAEEPKFLLLSRFKVPRPRTRAHERDVLARVRGTSAQQGQ